MHTPACEQAPGPRAGVDAARQSKWLATIVRDLPIEIDLDHSHVGNYDREAIVELFRELEFRTLSNRLPEMRADRKAAPKVERAAASWMNFWIWLRAIWWINISPMPSGCSIRR